MNLKTPDNWRLSEKDDARMTQIITSMPSEVLMTHGIAGSARIESTIMVRVPNGCNQQDLAYLISNMLYLLKGSLVKKDLIIKP